MGTATLHINNLGGYGGPARCYRVDPPRVLDGVDHEYVTVFLAPSQPHMDAEVCVFPATETGAVVGMSMRKRIGSHTLDADPVTPAEIEDCYVRALHDYGAPFDGYEIVEPAPEPTEGVV